MANRFFEIPMRTFLFSAVLCVMQFCPAVTLGNESGKHKLLEKHWSFDGVFGRFDIPSIQRGYKVYKEVCSACHSLKRIAFRNLAEIGFSEAEIKEISKSYQIHDGPDDAGEMFTRPGLPSDYMPAPYRNKNAAAAANNGAVPPDLSLIIKARADGANYVYSLLNGYKSSEPNSGGQYENIYFPAGALAMAPPLREGAVEFDDGTQSTVENMSADVVNFLQWAAEPEMEARKKMGLKVLSFLLITTALLYFAYKEVWKSVNKS